MNFKNNKKLPYYIIFLSIIFCLILGIWWLYLISKFATLLQTYVPNPAEINNLYRMILAEGSTFVILLNVVLISVFFLLRKEHRKYSSLQKFYAIFSHELKTPLTTLQLQLEILPEILNKSSLDKNKLTIIFQRLNDSATQLKYEVEKMLTLSQLELAPNYQLEKVDICKFLHQWREKQLHLENRISIQEVEKKACLILGNHSLLETVFNNLLRNSIKHSPASSPITISIKEIHNSKIVISYSDGGEINNLDMQRLGNLFYKSHRSNGSGLGLFIIKQMMHIMNGHVVFDTSHNQLQINLQFRADV